MPSIEARKEFNDTSPTDCYNAAEKCVETLGFSFVKKRPLGWFLQIKNASLNANIAFRPGTNTMGTFSLSSNTESEDALQKSASEFAEAIRKNL
ncbi:MAG: hypothetical protein K8R77_14760 [Anaerolineaceae bacterium]|nr:hypothetical protein [Anaerolineaceae bacterium]